MARIFASAAFLTAVIVSVGTSSSFAGILDLSNVPNLGPSTLELNGGVVTLYPGTPYAQMDASSPDNPELNYWVIPTAAATYTDGSGTSALTATDRVIHGKTSTYFVDASGAIAVNLTQNYNDDAIMGYSVSLDNNTNIPMAFGHVQTVNFAAPTPGPTMYKGTVGITLTDDDGGGAVLKDNGGASIYQAQIDGAPVLELFPFATLPGPFNGSHPFNFSVADGDSGTESATSGFLFGGPSLNTSLGIRLAFTLSANDSVGITSNFVVLPATGGGTPEPASLALLGLGAVGLLTRRR